MSLPLDSSLSKKDLINIVTSYLLAIRSLTRVVLRRTNPEGYFSFVFSEQTLPAKSHACFFSLIIVIIIIIIIIIRNVKTRVIPVIIGATGTISKSFRKYVSDIPGNHGVEELQKTAILGTAHIFRKVLT